VFSAGTADRNPVHSRRCDSQRRQQRRLIYLPRRGAIFVVDEPSSWPWFPVELCGAFDEPNAPTLRALRDFFSFFARRLAHTPTAQLQPSDEGLRELEAAMLDLLAELVALAKSRSIGVDWPATLEPSAPVRSRVVVLVKSLVATLDHLSRQPEFASPESC
jgi:hypothetical protein